MTTPVLKVLRDNGYFVSYHTYKHLAPLLDHNPNVDERVLYEPDPETGLPPRGIVVKYLKGKKPPVFLNLSETCEVSLVELEDPENPGSWIFGCERHPRSYTLGCTECHQRKVERDERIRDRNYYDENLSRVQYDPSLFISKRPEIFFGHEEMIRIDKLAKGWEKHFVVIWLQSSTAYHKSYPLWATVCREFCNRHPEVIVYSTGDEKARAIEVYDHPQIRSVVGKWSIREAMGLTAFADLIVGTESGIMHAAGCYDTPKLVLLSHSNPTNLTKYWENCTTIAPDVPCHPCHQIHDRIDSCPLVRIVHNYPKINHLWPICMAQGLNPDRVLEGMEYWYANHPSKKQVVVN